MDGRRKIVLAMAPRARVRPLNWVALVLAIAGLLVSFPLEQGTRQFALLGHRLDRFLVSQGLTGSALLILSMLWITGSKGGALKIAGTIVLTLVLLTFLELVVIYGR